MEPNRLRNDFRRKAISVVADFLHRFGYRSASEIATSASCITLRSSIILRISQVARKKRDEVLLLLGDVATGVVASRQFSSNMRKD